MKSAAYKLDLRERLVVGAMLRRDAVFYGKPGFHIAAIDDDFVGRRLVGSAPWVALGAVPGGFSRFSIRSAGILPIEPTVVGTDRGTHADDQSACT